MDKYMIGKSAVYGKLVAKPSLLTEVDEETFYREIDKSLKRHDLMQFKHETTNMKNLRAGITIGSEFFIIEKIQ